VNIFKSPTRFHFQIRQKLPIQIH